jgi:hypothetical protein
MPSCAKCGLIYFAGGTKIGKKKFCPKCAEQTPALEVAAAIPKEDAAALAKDFFLGPCPMCGKPGKGVDIRRDHRLVSAVVIEQRSGRRYVCCRSCAAKAQLGMLGQTFALGWWSPRGIFLTPVWLGKNIFELAKTGRKQPSRELTDLLVQEAAADIAAKMSLSQSPYVRDKNYY